MISLIEKAENGSYAWHKGQVRKYTGEPYYLHPKAVMEIVKTVPHSEAMQIKIAELDKANARIAQLETDMRDIKRLAVMVSDVNIATICNNAMKESTYTWLSEHDKAVEVKVLEEADKRCINLPDHADSVIDCSEVLQTMIEERK